MKKHIILESRWTDVQRYNCNKVKSDVKHHNPIQPIREMYKWCIQ
jgi:hypothetical protein